MIDAFVWVRRIAIAVFIVLVVAFVWVALS